jgi:hypothetical protein
MGALEARDRGTMAIVLGELDAGTISVEDKGETLGKTLR